MNLFFNIIKLIAAIMMGVAAYYQEFQLATLFGVVMIIARLETTDE